MSTGASPAESSSRSRDEQEPGTHDREHLSFTEIDFIKKLHLAFGNLQDSNVSDRLTSSDPQTTRKLYERKSNELRQEIDGLLDHLDRIDCAGTAAVVKELKDTTIWITELDNALLAASKDRELPLEDIYIALRNLEYEFTALLGTLYRQKHAFRSLQHTIKDLQDAQSAIEVATTPGALPKINVFAHIVPNLTESFASLRKEFRSFSDKSFPSFVEEEEERDTTRYLALSTIATFFSSITVTTLQFTYQETSDSLSNATNLFWFISLVFSVSCGVNSLLTIAWRKSHVYLEKRHAPFIIKHWFTKMPIAFMVISAVAFIIGLNLFAYSSHQPTSVATTLSAFTAFHTLSLIIVSAWFLEQLVWRHLKYHLIRRRFYLFLRLRKGVYSSNMEIASLKDWNQTRSNPEPMTKNGERMRKAFSNFVSFNGREADQEKQKFDIPGLGDSVLKKAVTDFLESLDLGLSQPTASLPAPALTSLPPSNSKASSRPLPLPQRAAAQEDKADTSFAASELFQWYFKQWNKKLFDVDSIELAGDFLLWGFDDLKRSFKDVIAAMRVADKNHSKPNEASTAPDVPACTAGEVN